MGTQRNYMVMRGKEYHHNGRRISWYCNPEHNTECDKRFCKHNINAIEKLCETTTKKEFALEIGQTVQEKEYTPPRSK